MKFETETAAFMLSVWLEVTHPAPLSNENLWDVLSGAMFGICFLTNLFS